MGAFDPPLKWYEPPEDNHIEVGTCCCCGYEIFDGEDYYDFDGDTCCYDCLRDYADAHFKVKGDGDA